MLSTPVDRVNFTAWLPSFARIMLKLLTDRMHGDVILTLKDGQIQFVRVHTTFLAGQLPKV